MVESVVTSAISPAACTELTTSSTELDGDMLAWACLLDVSLF